MPPPQTSVTAFTTASGKRRRFSIEPPYGSVRLVGGIAHELLEQVVVGRVDLDAVEAGPLGVLGRPAVILDDARDLVRLQRPRRDVGLHAVSVKAVPSGLSADGATGSCPSGCRSGCEIRPVCQSCRKIRPAVGVDRRR